MGFRRILMAVAASAGVLAGAMSSSAPALAAAPEAPKLEVEAPVHATTATFLGVLNPAAPEPTEGDTYKFLYKAGTGTECEGGGETSSRLSLGGVHEEVSETVSGLTANTEYAVCLSVTSLESPSKTTVSKPAVPFKTTVPPEKPETEPAPQVTITATSAKLEGTLNPLGTATTKAGWYFAYDEGSSCTGAGEQRTGQEPEVEGAALSEKTEVTNLEPDRTYGVCLVATNEFGNATVGNEVVVETLAPPPAIVSESGPALVTPVPVTGSMEATLTGTVNPNNQVTECHFQYGTVSVSEHEKPCEQGTLRGLEQGVSLTVTGLEPEKLYHWQIVLKNAKGEETKGTGTPEEFETLSSPSGVQTGSAEEVTATSARLGSLLEPNKLNPGGEAKYYIEYGEAPCDEVAEKCGTKSAEATATGSAQQEVPPIEVSGLEPSTTYHYWLVATNAVASKPVHGAAEEFTTKPAAPSVQTGVAEDVTETSAKLTGELNPGAAEAEYYVEYVLPSNTIERSATAFVSGRVQASVTPIVLTGLQPNTTYSYWLVAKSSAVSEPVRGEVLQFTTQRSRAELEAQAAAARKPAEELAAANAAKQKLEAEEAKRAAEAAAVNAAKQKQYGEIAAQTAGLLRLEAEAGKQKAKVKKAKSKPASCRKGFVKKHNKCVPRKSKKKGKVKK
jgi:hypothetical protein